MALTRAMLKAMELTDEQVNKIIAAHTETVDGLKDVQADIQKQLDAANKSLKETSQDGSSWREKYEASQKELENERTKSAREAEQKAKGDAFKELLKDAGISEKRLNAILKITNLDEIELAKDGHIKGADKLTEFVKEEYSDFITTTSTHGEDVSNPPAHSTGKMTRDEILNIKDTSERQRAIAENPDLF